MTGTSQIWRVARALQIAHPSASRLPALLFLTDNERVPDPIPVIRRLPHGSGIIIRDYDAPDRLIIAERASEAAHDCGLVVLVAGDALIARHVQAHGVHLPEYQAQLAGRFRAEEPEWLVTVAAHGRKGLVAADRFGADAALLAPVFATASHPGAKTLGPVRFSALVRSTKTPVYALGGVTSITARGLRGSGAVGIAAISGVEGP